MPYLEDNVYELLNIKTQIIIIPKRLFLQDSHNQAGIVHKGALGPLLKLLKSSNRFLQQNAAFTLYGLADNEVRCMFLYQDSRS